MLNRDLHEENMKNILKNIFESKISDFLAFKGGTLVYLQYGLDRFSTDVDIDLLDSSQEELVIQEIEKILLSLGDIKSFVVGRTLHRWIFRYDDFGANLKVELNKRIWLNNSYDDIILEGVKMLAMNQKSIFTNKLVALYERQENRDLYDVYFFFQNKYEVCEKLIMERTGLTINKFMLMLMEMIPKSYNSQSILHKLGEVVDEKQKYWIKNNLINETLIQIKSFLENNK